jgi:hypothetical protein
MLEIWEPVWEQRAKEDRKPGGMADGQTLEEETGLSFSSGQVGQARIRQWIWARLGTAGLGEMIMQAHWETGRPVTPGLVDRPDESTSCPWKAPLDGFHAPKSLLLQPTGAALAKMGALGSGTGQGKAQKNPRLLKSGAAGAAGRCVCVRAWASIEAGSPASPSTHHCKTSSRLAITKRHGGVPARIHDRMF